MSTGTKISLEQAKAIAKTLIDAIGIYCIRIEVAGSIRREQPEVGDIELVAIPHTITTVPAKDMFGDPVGNPEHIRPPGFAPAILRIAKHVIKGKPSTGKYVQFVIEDDVKVDLFITTPSSWGYIYLIRTGSAEFSHAVASRWTQFGYKGKDGELTKNGSVIPTPSESSIFNLLGMRTPPAYERQMTAKGLSLWIDH